MIRQFELNVRVELIRELRMSESVETIRTLASFSGHAIRKNTGGDDS